MVKCFMGRWSKVWWHLTCYWRGILVPVVLALFLGGTVSAPYSPLLSPNPLYRPCWTLQTFPLLSQKLQTPLISCRTRIASVYVTTHFNAYHTSFLRISVFTCLWLPSYQSLFCRSRMKIEIVHTFNDSLHFSPKHWDSQCMLMKILNYFHYSNIVLFFDNTYLFRHYIFPVKLSQ